MTVVSFFDQPPNVNPLVLIGPNRCYSKLLPCCFQNSEDKVDKERALDQKINRIQQNNKALEQRRKEIEKDKLLHA